MSYIKKGYILNPLYIATALSDSSALPSSEMQIIKTAHEQVAVFARLFLFSFSLFKCG